jgi:N-acetylmuramoyl-L-alanine amidase
MSFSLSQDRKMLVNDFASDDGAPLVEFIEAGSYGRGLKWKKLKYLVMHYTAGRGLDSTVNHFKDPANKVSAHLVVGRDGRVVQMVPFDRPAWHAGADSYWRPDGAMLTDKGINFYGLGIEFDNYGPLTHVPGAKGRSPYRTWFGRDVSPEDVAEVDPKAKGSFGVRFWHEYTEEQLARAEELTMLLVHEFGLVDVLGHSDVAPGRKQDPGPLFPTGRLRSLALGRM